MLLLGVQVLIGFQHQVVLEGRNITSGALHAATVYATIVLPWSELQPDRAANVVEPPHPVLVGVAFGTAMGFWYGLELVRRAQRRSRQRGHLGAV